MSLTARSAAARIAAARTARAADALVVAPAPDAVVTPAPAPAREVPAFIVARADNATTNRAISAALRSIALEPRGGVWVAAQAHVAAGGLLTPVVLADLRRRFAPAQGRADGARGRDRVAERAANRAAHARVSATREAARLAAK